MNIQFIEAVRLSDKEINDMLNAAMTKDQVLGGVTVDPETNASIGECAIQLAESIKRFNAGELKPLDYPL